MVEVYFIETQLV